jgi:hypothetical protein
MEVAPKANEEQSWASAKKLDQCMGATCTLEVEGLGSSALIGSRTLVPIFA